MEREEGANIWHVRFGRGSFTDAAVQGLFTIHGFPTEDVTLLFDGCSLALLITVPAGAYFYGPYPMVHHRYLAVLLRGQGTFAADAQQVELSLCGQGDLLVTGGMDDPSCIAAIREALSHPL